MAAASSVNSFQAFSASSAGATQQAGHSNGVDFGATLADAQQTAKKATPAPAPSPSPTPAPSPSPAQTQAKQDAAQNADASTDSAAKASKAAAREAAAQDKDNTATDGDTSSWLAMLQAMLMQPATNVTPTDPTAATATSGASSTDALASLNAMLTAHQGSVSDDALTASDAKALLQDMKAGDGKAANSMADIAATDGNFLPLLQNAAANSAATTSDTDDTALAQLTAATQQHPIAANQDQTAKPTTAVHQIAVPVTDNKWGDAVAQRVSMMIGKQEQQLDMQLNPPHLGPMEVRLSMAQDQASVIFTSQHAGVREALAAATPRLSALLADQGITLTNVQVASDSLNQQAQQQQMQRQFDGSNGQSQGRSQWGGVVDASQAALTPVTGTIRVPVARSGLNLYI